MVEPQHKNQPNNNLIACPICKKKLFVKSQSLGGHMSKSHPNQSQKYVVNLKIRKERE
jgi:hypothetical protein